MIIKAPRSTDYLLAAPSVFLAGSIEMGKAELWQERLAKDIGHEKKNLYVYDPRRDDWDSSWEQNINNEQFSQQVRWELDHIGKANLVVFYFDKNTQSPITLMELGLVAGSGKPAVVFCPEGFWRKGNVDIICEVYNIPMAKTYEDLVSFVNSVFWRKHE